MMLKDIDFNRIRKLGFIGLAIKENDKTVASGFISEVLRQIPEFAHREVKGQYTYFNEWVIEIN